VQYEPLKIGSFTLYLELGTNHNIYSRPQLQSSRDESTNYLKSYLDVGISVQVAPQFNVAIVFKDVATYHSTAINFENRNDFTVTPILREFFAFPQFSVVYILN
jgi:gamma-glutamyl phosphate reductase